MKKAMILMLSLMMLSGSAMAQMTEQREPSMRPRRVRMTQEQMTEKMVSDLKLDEKQTKKVTKLNKKNTVSTETGKVDVTLGDGCTWNLTADTHITSFTGDASQIKPNGHRLWVNGKEMGIR